MLFALTLYIALALAVLAVLSAMILKIGTMLADCPEHGDRAKSAAVTIATGYAAIGAGGVILIGAVLPLLQEEYWAALVACLGLASLCLGLGFTNAVATLRAVLIQTPEQAPQPELVRAEPTVNAPMAEA